MQTKIFCLLILSLIVCTLQQTYDPTLPVWPYPKSLQYISEKKHYQIINWKDFRFSLKVEKQTRQPIEVIQEAFKRYQQFIFVDSRVPSQKCDQCIQGLQAILLDEPDEEFQKNQMEPNLEMYEGYSLRIQPNHPSKMFELSSKSVWGLLRGIETFSQLVQYDVNTPAYVIYNTSFVIEDEPRFKWRGLMIDTARHYLSVDTITSFIDTLAMSKLNVLHWHIIDAESFPFEVPEYPELTRKGAWAPHAIYTEEDIQKIIRYAFLRGIRVIPEFDSPGHTDSWGYGYPEITAKCPKYQAVSPYRNNIALNPASELTFQVLEGIIKQATKVFKEPYIHLGADEVRVKCWEEDERITEFMRKNGWGNNYGLLLKYFQERLEKIYRKYGKTMIAWGELLLTNKEYPVPKDVIIQAWQQPQHLKQVVQRGYRAIHSGRYYLDMTQPGKSRYLWQDTWKDFYENEPFALNLTKEEQKLVLGGEACMWGENVDDSVINERVWPRAAAVAERLWSPMGINDLKAAEKRLIHFRCNVLIKRGYAASAIYPDYCPYIYMRRWTPSPLYNFNF